jgi:hypothetical protein
MRTIAVLVVEQELGQRLGQLGLADAGGAEEQERADRPVRVLQPGARAAHGLGDRLHRLVLTDTRLPISSSMRSSLSRSPSSILSTGTPVQRETMGDMIGRHGFSTIRRRHLRLRLRLRPAFSSSGISP